MAGKQSAGILLYRRRQVGPEVFLAHPGGPFWTKKDHGAWTFPKGEFADGEDPLEAAQREFTEETSLRLVGPFVPLGSVRQSGGKTVYIWATVGDCDAGKVISNTCRIEWPARSGRFLEFPEIDRAAWFSCEEAATKLNKAQVAFIERLKNVLGTSG